MSQSTVCRLCLTSGQDFRSLYYAHGGPNDLYEMALEYLHPKTVDMEAAKHLTNICLECFEHLDDFHSFQISVKTAQLKLIDHDKDYKEVVIKTERNDDALTDNEFVLKTEEEESMLEEFQSLTEPGICWEINPVNEKPPSDSENAANVKEEEDEKQFLAAIPTPTVTDFIIKQELEIIDVQEDNSLKPSFVCKICSKAYFSASSLGAHLRRRHPGVRPSHFDSRYNPITKKFNCEICDNSFPRKNQLSHHMRTVHDDQDDVAAADGNVASKTRNADANEPTKSFKCEICKNSFRTNSALRRHLHSQHPGIVPSMFDSAYDAITNRFKCNVCEKSFRLKINLLSHMRSRHTKPAKTANEKAATKEAKKQDAKSTANAATGPISQTETTITSEGYWANYRANVVQAIDRPKKFKCNICGISYVSMAGLRNHVRRNHPGFTASQFDSSYDPITKTHKCHVCDNTFPRKNTLALHFVWTHGKKRKEVDEAQFPHKCGLCVNRYRNGTRLADHMKQQHPGVKPYMFNPDYDAITNTFKCRYCVKTFQRNSNLVVHMAKQHKEQYETSRNDEDIDTTRSKVESESEDSEVILDDSASPTVDTAAAFEEESVDSIAKEAQAGVKN